MAIDGQGQQMVTAGADGQVKVWDARKLQAMHAYFSHAPVECLDISQRGLLAVGYGRNIQVWRDAPNILLEHRLLLTGCVWLESVCLQSLLSMPPTLSEAQQAANTSKIWLCEAFHQFGALLYVTLMHHNAGVEGCADAQAAVALHASYAVERDPQRYALLSI